MTRTPGQQPGPRPGLGPRWGVGPGRADPEWARFASAADVLRYLCDFHGWTHAQLAERSGVRREQILEYSVQKIVYVVGRGVAEGQDVVVGGEVAAVLQGVQVPTRQITVFVRPEHREAFTDLARKHWLGAERHADERVYLRSGPIVAELRLAPVRPPTRTVAFGDHDVPVVDLKELVDDPAAIGGSVWAAAGRLLDRAG